MHISVFAVGRMKKGPDCELAERYFQRFAKSASSLGLFFSGVQEISESCHPVAARRRQEESARMLSSLVENSCLVVLDLRGQSLTSRVFAEKISCWRGEGKRNLVIALGGPDGHDEVARQRADLILSFGLMTWPHQLARIMLAEQLYRAAMILNRHPYHRE